MHRIGTGELDRHDSLPRDRRKDYPELLMVTNEPKNDGSPSDTKYTGRQWHSDMSFTTEPSLGSLLKSYAVPEVGGERSTAAFPFVEKAPASR